MIDPELNRVKAHPAALRLYASRVHLDKQGRDYFGTCPFHAEKTGSFSVSQGDDGCWMYYCFGCAEGGDVIKFVQKMDNLGFKEALAVVRDFVGDTSRVDAVFKAIEPASKEFKTYTLAQYQKLEDALMESPAGKDWLQDVRGIGGGTAQRLHLGFKQDLGAHAGPKNKHIADKGWIAFPCIQDDIVVGIKYRSIVEKAFARAPGMATELFNTETVDPLEPVWLVEGEPDACVLDQAGFRAVSLSSAGHVLTPAQRDQLLEAEYVVLAGDNDAGAGVAAMARLKADFGDRAIQIEWPSNLKDANDVFLKECKRDIVVFAKACREAVQSARAQPMKGVYALADFMRKSKAGKTADNPLRFHWPWPGVDKMANFLPGDVALVTATDTGMGKSQWVLQATIFAARAYGEVVLNYQGEMSAAEVANIVTANLSEKDRNNLTPEDYWTAADDLGAARYYVGADPSLTTAMPVLDLIEEAVVRFGVTTLVIDHIHFICRNSVNEVQEQANAMQRIKNMARKYGLKAIVVAQPRKADQRNEGKERQLSGVKGSETLVSDSSIVYFLHREVLTNIDPANPPKDDYAPETTVRNKKARSKGTGAAFVRLFFNGNVATFVEMGLDKNQEM